MIRKMIALLENIGRSWWKREGLQENVPSRLNNGNMETIMKDGLQLTH